VAKYINFPNIWRTLNILAYEQPIHLEDLANRLGISVKGVKKLINHMSLAGVPDYMPDRLLSFDQFKLEQQQVYCFIDLGIFKYFKNNHVQRLYDPQLIRNFFIQNPGTTITVTIKYTDQNGATSQRQISGWNYYEKNHREFIDTYCHLRQNTRTFLLSRIQKLEAKR
jgi:predicted DNA-binding transcriptional regulator YafY